jgi:hypothetical protein
MADSTVHRQHFINSVIDPDTGESLEYRHLIKGPEADKWKQANINEIGRSPMVESAMALSAPTPSS